MAIDPVSAGMAGVGLISSLFGSGEPELPPEVKRILQKLMRSYKDTMAYSRGIPGSDPQEQAALAQARALQGNEQAQQYGSLLASYQPGSGMDTNAADAQSRFRSNAASQLGATDMQFLQQFLQSRQQMRYGGAQSILGTALSAANSPRPQQPGSDFSGLLMQLGQQWGQQQKQGGVRPSGPGGEYANRYNTWNSGGTLQQGPYTGAQMGGFGSGKQPTFLPPNGLSSY